MSVSAGGEGGGRQDRRWSGDDGGDGGLGLLRRRHGGDDGGGEKMGVDSAGEQGLLVIAFESEFYVGRGNVVWWNKAYIMKMRIWHRAIERGVIGSWRF